MIELFDGYYIVVDAYNYSLATKRQSKNKDGELVDKWEYISYHNDLATALVAFKRLLVRKRLENRLSGLEQAVADITEVSERVERFIKDNIPS